MVRTNNNVGFRALQDFSSFPSDELLAQVDDSVLSEFICDVIKFIYRVSCKNFVCWGWGELKCRCVQRTHVVCR